LSAYADTSFLVSLYVPDANSVPAARHMSRARLPLWLTPLAELELTNAMELRLFRRELSPAEVEAALAALADDVANGVLTPTPLPSTVFEKAREISRQHTARLGARTLDILHVASALALGARTFYTFDKSQRKLALAAGLTTV